MIKDSLVFSNFRHRPMRSLTSIVGIGVSMFLIIATIGLANGTLRGNAEREANIGAEIMIRGSGTFGLSGLQPFRLPVSQREEIAKIEGVQRTVLLGQNLDLAEDTETGSRLIDGVNFDEYAEIAGLQIIEGRKIAAEANEAVIDTAWAEQKKLHVGSVLKIYDKQYTVVGTYQPPSGARIKIPLPTMQKQLTGNTENCTSILVKLRNPTEENAVLERIAKKFPDDQIILTRNFEELYLKAVPALDIFLNVVIGVATVISTLLILLTMYTSVNERTRQIGILKSLGMSKTGIAWTITLEALMICFCGFLFGLWLSAMLGIALTQTASSMKMSIEWKWMLLSLVGALLSGALGALYPALRAARLDAVEALSYE